MEFRADINGLRAVAVLAVLLYHFAVPGFGGGFAGVDIFYVLSGYLMTGILHGRLDQGARAIGPFYLARARRIVPALVVTCAAVLVLGWFWVSPLHYRQLAQHAAASLTFVSNILYWQQINYFNPDATGFWLLHTWSLSLEWQFYLVYPLVLLAVARLGARDLPSRDARLRFALVAGIGLSFALAVVMSWRAPQGAFYLLPPRAWELLGGGLVFLVQSRWRAGPLARRVLASAGLVATLASIALLDAHSPWATVWVAVPVAATMAVLLANAPGPVLGNAVAQALGRWSYSIYLWHWPVAVFLGEWRPGAGWGWVLLALGVSVLLGFLSYRLVENPTRRGLGRLAPLPQTLGHFVTAGVVALAALAIFEAAGVRSRLPLANAAAYQRMSDERQDIRFPVACRMDGRSGHARLCGEGREDAPRLLVIGDSHAQQWYGWFTELGEGLGLRVDFYTWEGCSLGGATRPDRDCDGFWRDAAAEADRINASAVIITSNWEVPVTGNPARDGAPPPEYDAQRRTRARLPAVLAAAREGGRPVLVVGALPTIGRATPDDIISRLFRGSSVDDLAVGDCAAFRWRAAGITHDLKRLAADAGADFVDPTDTVCDEARTPVVSADGHLLYRDGNHFSAVGAQRWGPGIFMRFVNRSLHPRPQLASPHSDARPSGG